MLHSSSITSLSWIPSEAEGSTRMAFEAGLAHSGGHRREDLKRSTRG